MQKKRRINHPLKLLLCSGVSLRRSAIILKVNQKTVARRLAFLGKLARAEHEQFLSSIELKKLKIKTVQFDELKTSEITKCKPLSVALAVSCDESSERKILAIEVSKIPADGHLAKIARKKYGFRPNHREQGLDSMFQTLKRVVSVEAQFTSDQWGTYPKHVKRNFPCARHETVEGKRGCVAGQGELKKIVFDPLFNLNHTCAMLRANINRLFRRTWCTTKRMDRLLDHLMIYVAYHNQVLTA